MRDEPPDPMSDRRSAAIAKVDGFIAGMPGTGRLPARDAEQYHHRGYGLGWRVPVDFSDGIRRELHTGQRRLGSPRDDDPAYQIQRINKTCPVTDHFHGVFLQIRSKSVSLARHSGKPPGAVGGSWINLSRGRLVPGGGGCTIPGSTTN